MEMGQGENKLIIDQNMSFRTPFPKHDFTTKYDSFSQSDQNSFGDIDHTHTHIILAIESTTRITSASDCLLQKFSDVGDRVSKDLGDLGENLELSW